MKHLHIPAQPDARFPWAGTRSLRVRGGRAGRTALSVLAACAAILAVFSLPLILPTAARAAERNGDTLAAFATAIEKATTMDRYAFTLAMKLNQDGRGSVSPISAKVDPAGVMEIEIGPHTYYHQRGGLAFMAEGGWEKFGTGSRVPPSAETKGDPGVRVAGMLGFFTRLVPPHKLLARFDAKMVSVTKAPEPEDGFTIFTGDLTLAGIKHVAMHGPGHHGGGSMPGAETYRGHAKFWVDRDGTIMKFEFYTEGKTTNKGRELKVKNTRTYEISAIGTASFTAPKQALTALANNAAATPAPDGAKSR